MKSRGVISLLFLMGITGLKAINAQNSAGLNSSEKPNVVVILSDDQGWGDFSIHGNTNLSTPNIDRIALEGARFQNFYVQPVCSPTRAEFLTGRYHQRGGVYSTSAGGERLDLDEKTIGRIFKEAGFKTAIYGKWHNGTQYPYHPNGRGFNDFYGFASGHWGNYFSPWLEHNGKIVKGSGYLTNDITDHSIDFIKKYQREPFFLYVAYNTPHAPMQVPDKWFNKFENKNLSLFAEKQNLENIKFTRAALAMCENIDWNVGRILRTIDSLDLSKNTILLYFNDNGPNEYRWNGAMKGKKGSLDEGGIRSPLFVRWPAKITPGKNIEQLSGAIDLLPTLVDMAQISYTSKKKLDGISLKKFLINDNPPLIDRILINTWKGKISVRNQRYRLSDDNMLFDIADDRSQTRNLEKLKPKVKKELLKEKESFRQDIARDIKPSDNRPFLIGHPDAEYTHLPARDGIAQGNIVRSNKFPNSSFFTHWNNVDDFISWDTKVLESGEFEVIIYYTSTQKALNSEYELSLGKHKLKFTVNDVFNPPLRGMENDRFKRKNSYVKDFKPLSIGKIHLDKVKISLVLKSLSLPEKEGIDVRLILFKRIRPNEIKKMKILDFPFKYRLN